MKTSLRGMSAVTVVIGIVLGLFGLAVPAAPAGALTETTGLVCNNQKNRADQDCEGANAHGRVTATFDNGNLVFDIDATGNFGGWRQIYLCIPGTPKTKSADCQGNSASVLDPRPTSNLPNGAYDVTQPTANTENAKDVAFSCAKSIDATVFAAALPQGSDPFNWTVHVNTCDGGTDEAFGSAQRTTTPPDGPTYNCVAASPVGQTTATLRGSTTDESVTSATFSFTSPTGAPAGGTDADSNGGFSFDATQLQPNTSYTYAVDFKNANATVRGSAPDCTFVTAAVPDTYECLAPTGVTATSATLQGRTSDGEIDTASFKLTPQGGSPTASSGVEAGNSNNWSASASGLTPDTSYTYTVDFFDNTTVEGTGSGSACSFRTSAAAGGNTGISDTIGAFPQPSTHTVAPDTTPAPVVAGVVLARETPAAVAPTADTKPAIANVALARTGFTSDTLLPLGVALVLLGLLGIALGGRRPLVIFARPPGDHFR